MERSVYSGVGFVTFTRGWGLDEGGSLAKTIGVGCDVLGFAE
jgi:hypothetical protein